MTHTQQMISCAALLVVMVGCTTLTVRKVPAPGSTGRQPEGQRYALPIPVIQIVPGDNGTASAEVIYLPNPDRTYAIDAESVMTAHHLDVTVTGGLLDSVRWSPDSTAVAADLVKASGEIGVNVLEAHIKRAAEQREAIALAEATLSGHELELAQKEAELEYYRANPGSATENKIHTLEIEISNLRLQIEADRTAVEAARSAGRTLDVESVQVGGSGSGFSRMSSSQAPTVTARRAVEIKGGAYAEEVWGGMLFVVREELGSPVRLEPIRYKDKRAQLKFATAPTYFKRLEILTLVPTGIVRAPAASDGVRALTYTSSRAVESVEIVDFVRRPDDTPLPFPPPLVSANGTSISVGVTNVAAGWYELIIEYKFKQDDDSITRNAWSVQFTIDAAAVAPTLSPTGHLRLVEANGRIAQQLTASSDVESIDFRAIMYERQTADGWKRVAEPQISLFSFARPRTVTLDAASMISGRYRATIPFTYKAQFVGPGSWNVEFTVVGGVDYRPPTLMPRGKIIVRPDDKGQRAIRFTSSRAISDIDTSNVTCIKSDQSSIPVAVALETGTTVFVTFDSNDTGDFKLTIPFTHPGPSGVDIPGRWSIDVLLR